jgi:hypothetical protein
VSFAVTFFFKSIAESKPSDDMTNDVISTVAKNLDE